MKPQLNGMWTWKTMNKFFLQSVLRKFTSIFNLCNSKKWFNATDVFFFLSNIIVFHPAYVN